MPTYSTEVLAVTRGYLIGIAPFVVGIVVVSLLIAAVWLGMRVREQEPRPTREPHPRRDAWQGVDESDEMASAGGHGPGHQDSEAARTSEHTEVREPEDVPQNGVRRLPHEFHHKGSRRSDSQEPKKWDEGKSGGFGSGGWG